ncbi:MAG: DNA-formamidopyrimidine glycosylase [Acholeplasmataceae bacterium]|nr:DNA-formamidopyrimidine glycosylase [Acholeplasmataceae bacterium]
MPELPEVRTVVKFLNNYQNKTITDITILYPLMSEAIKEKLINKTILSVTSKGKYIVFNLDKGFLISHLRMEGKYLNHPTITKHDHIIFHFKEEILKYNDVRKFGTFDYHEKNPFSKPPLSKLGPEPFDADEKLIYPLFKKTNRDVKTILLDQTVMSGIGNIYANEILFASKISPFRKASQVTLKEVATLIEQSVKILNEAIKLGGTTIKSFSVAGEVGYFTQNLFVHGRYGEECLVCGNIIKKMKLKGRMCYYCESCQK